MASLNHIPQLAIQPEQPTDPLTQYGKLLSVQHLQAQGEIQKQQLTAAQLENEQRQLQVAQAQQDQKDQINFRQAFQDANGDPDKTVQLAAKAGVGPKLLVPYQQGILDHKTKLLTYNKDQQAFAQSQADLQKGAWDTVNNAPEADRPTVYQQQLQGLQQMGVNVSQMPPQYDPQSFKLMGAVVTGHKQMLEDTFKQGEIAKNAATQKEAEVGTQIKQQQLASGMLPGVPIENQAYPVWKAKQDAEGKPSDLDTYQRHVKTMVPAFNFNVQNATGGGPGASPADVAKKFGMTQEAFDQAAEKYFTTGTLPPVGRSGNGVALNRALMNRSGDLHPGASLAANSAEFKANQASLGKLQTNFDQVSAFENTAGKNLDVFLNTAKPIIDSGSPWINKPLRSVAAGALGSADQAAFNAARQTAVTEIAKVLNSSNASGVLSDSARHEVEGLIGPTATLKQIYSAAGVLRQDMANRHQAYQDQITDIQGRMKTGGQNQNNATPPPPATTGFSWDKLPEHKAQ